MFTAEIKSERDEDICILVKVENHSHTYICDCGEARNLTVKECQNTAGIFISHTHIDHFVNFDTILRHQLGSGKHVVICGPEGIIEQVQHRIKSYCWNLVEADAIVYEVREIQALGKIRSVTLRPPYWEQENEKFLMDSKTYEEKDFYVEYEILDHKTDSIAYHFQARDKVKIELADGLRPGKWVAELKQAFEKNEGEVEVKIDDTSYKAKELFHMLQLVKGKRLGIILDHAAHEENHQKIKQRFQGCDEVFIEAFYKDEDQAFAEKNFHSHASMSGSLMKTCQVKKARPVHFSRKYQKEEVEQLIGQFEKAFFGT